MVTRSLAYTSTSTTHPGSLSRVLDKQNVSASPSLTVSSMLTGERRFGGSRTRQTAGYDVDGDEIHYPTRPVDKDKAEAELVVNIKKATNPDETAPKQKHVRSESHD